MNFLGSCVRHFPPELKSFPAQISLLKSVNRPRRNLILHKVSLVAMFAIVHNQLCSVLKVIFFMPLAFKNVYRHKIVYAYITSK